MPGSQGSEPVAGAQARRLILRGYGPLAALVVVLIIVTMLVPSRPERDEVNTFLSGQAAPGGVAPTALPAPAEPAATTAAKVKGNRKAAKSASAGGKASTAGTPGAAAVPGAAASSSGPVLADSCSGGTRQDANSAYSPPCIAFSGDNGGATSRGVTRDTIRVAFREIDSPLGDPDSELGKTAEKKGILPSPEAQERTRAALLAYFNSTYQLYGRTVEIVSYAGRGDAIKELGGTGQEAANADALRVAQEIKAFADMTAISQPYLDALVRQKVVAFGGLHLPKDYYIDRAPYAWGQLIDCTALMDSAVDLIAKRLPPDGLAGRAGSAALREKPRSYGIVYPDDAVYAQCVLEAGPALRAAGVSFAKEIRYSLELAKLQQETPNMAAQLKNAGVTTVILVSDPILPFFLSGSATQQDFWPEWFMTGTVLTDVDVVGQFYDQDQWQFAYGQSYLADIRQGKASESYRAYKKIRDDEPTLTRDLDYYSLLMLFIGLQMAGPNLTPETFQRGLFSYPGADGPLGHWSWGPGDYTAIDDAREIYYDPRALSPFNNQPGRYVSPDGDRRYRGQWPTRDPGAPVAAAAAP